MAVCVLHYPRISVHAVHGAAVYIAPAPHNQAGIIAGAAALAVAQNALVHGSVVSGVVPALETHPAAPR